LVRYGAPLEKGIAYGSVNEIGKDLQNGLDTRMINRRVLIS